MQYSFTENGAIVAMVGEFTFSDHTVFMYISKRLFGTESQAVVIDLSTLNFIDSAGLGMLLIARDEAISGKRELILRGPQGQVKRMFAVTKFDTLFTVEG